MKLDLGCGRNKKEGFIGVDLIDAQGIIKSDILSYLKTLGDNSVDEVRMFHSLEHVSANHYIYVIKNLLRVCKNGAIIEIGVPYYNNSFDAANPHHNIHFSEHSFRFFCREKEDRHNVIKKQDLIADYSFGLWDSANEGEFPGYVRIKKIEYIYLPEFKDKSEAEKDFARRHYHNVVLNMNTTLEVEK